MNAGETYDETLESIGFILEFCRMFCLCLQAFWVVVGSGSLAPAFVLGQWDFTLSVFCMFCCLNKW